MNNNNNSNRNNNRRRGRGNRQQGGGNQNRIDSRARGNAPQMLDKYRKLAQDAQHNGDRVQAEYYLQFADHYFRVIADSRPRTEDGRGQRRDDRDFSNEEDGDEDDMEGQRGGQQGRQREDRPREDRQRDDRPREDRQRDDRPREERQRDDRQREGRGDRNRPQRQQNRRDEAPAEEGETGTEGTSESAFEPAENPFVRPSRTRDSRRTRATRDTASDETAEMTSDAGEIDAAALPPSISVNAGTEGEPAATRKLPPRRRRKPADEEGEGDNLTAVG